MNKNGREAGPAERGSSSWADETLPLGLRKELLSRELQQSISAKARARPADRAPGLTGRKADERSRERPG